MKTMDEIRALIADIRDPNGRCPTEPLWVALLQKVESVVRERDEARETTRATAKALSIASDGARAEAERADRAESALAALRAAPPDAMREALEDAQSALDAAGKCLLLLGDVALPASDAYTVPVRAGGIRWAIRVGANVRAAAKKVDAALAPAPPAALRPACPGPECPYCSGEACRPCGPDLGTDVTLGKRPPCEHDAIDRHCAPRAPTPTENKEDPRG